MEEIVNWIIWFIGIENTFHFIAFIIILIMGGIGYGIILLAHKISQIKNGLLNLIIGIILALLFSTAAEMLIAALTTKMFELASWLEYVNPYLQAIAGPLAFSACAMISAGNNRNWIYVITVSFFILSLALWSFTMIGIHFIDINSIIIIAIRLLASCAGPFIIYHYKGDLKEQFD